MRGERLIHLAGFESAKLAAGAVLLAPYSPLLFRGEEYGESAPFPYFISHSELGLIDAVRKGRREEFQSSEEPPDPQDEATFQSAKLNLDLRTKQPHAALFEFYRELMRTRKETPSLASHDKHAMEVAAWEKKHLLFVRRWSGGSESFIVFNFDSKPQNFETSLLSGRRRRASRRTTNTRWKSPPGRKNACCSSGAGAAAARASSSSISIRSRRTSRLHFSPEGDAEPRVARQTRDGSRRLGEKTPVVRPALERRQRELHRLQFRFEAAELRDFASLRKVEQGDRLRGSEVAGGEE